MIKYLRNRIEFLAVFFVFIISLLFHLLIIQEFEFWFCTDTDGYWLHAATLIGRDWSGVAKYLTSYYSWGYSILLTIPMLLTNNVSHMLKIAVVINCALCAGVVPIIYSLGKRIFNTIDKKFILFISLVISLYPTYIMDSAVVLSEALIFFLYFWILYAFYNYIECEKPIWGVISAVSVGYLYIVHNRNLGIVIAYLFCVVLMFVKKKKYKYILYPALLIVLMLMVKSGINSWVLQHESYNNSTQANTYNSVVSSLKNNISLYKLITLIEYIIGEIWYTFAGTFLIAGVGISAIIKRLLASNSKEYKKSIWCIFLILSWLFSIGISALFFNNGDLQPGKSIGVAIYGRYMECTIGIFILYGLCFLYEKKKEIKTIGIVAYTFVALTILVNSFTASYNNVVYNYFSVVAILLPIKVGAIEISIIKVSIAMLVIGVGIIYFMNQSKRIFKYISICICMCMFLYIGYNSTCVVSSIYKGFASPVNNPTDNSDFMSVCSYINENKLSNIGVFCDDPYEAFSFQFIEQDVKFRYIDDINAIEDSIDEFIIINKGIEYTSDLFECIYENDSYKVGVISK